MKGIRTTTALGILLLMQGCSLVGYPSGSVPNDGFPSPGPVGSRTPASAPARAPSGGSPATPASGDIDEAPPLNSGPARVLREDPENLRDAGRRYEVFGVEYHVLETPVGYDESGVASWYGEAFNGRPTASGEIFDMYGLSAAHRSLPLMTWVEVQNLDNGRRVIVQVNDRGPFVDTEDRLIDLSYGAARVLGVVGPGLARVRIRAVEPPAGG